ncbi:hypothetical protein TSAR_009789 [Trichomalopsis sarcophagae]|uniref:C2H2-type domain-containing protein n=1 Tax=Trichomalopsis sarcophagae TaxID=543379 RepID=A0A232ET27_9HYME|nr:hypothetical protein TSAR_009789 [Trichomalopsis sarcophagae]
MFKKCLENRIVCRCPGFKCYLCHHEIQDKNFIAVEKHIETDKHQQRINGIDKTMRAEVSRKLETVSEKQRGIIAKNQITTDVKHNFLYCHICKCSISGISNTLEHIKGSCHARNFSAIENKNQMNMPKNSSTNQVGCNHLTNNDYITLDKKTKWFKCHACNCQISGSENVLQHTQTKLHKDAANAIKDKKIFKLVKQSIDHNVSVPTKSKDDFMEIRFCTSCQINLKNTAMLQFHSLMHFYKDVKTPLILDIIKFRFDQHEKAIIQCLLCNTFVYNNEIVDTHFRSPLHLKRLKFFKYVQDDIELDDADNQQINLEKMNFKPHKQISKALLCTLCDVSVSTAADKKDHLQGKKHKKNSLLPLENKIEKISNKISVADYLYFYPCYLCEKSFINAENLLDHYQEKKHKLKLKFFRLVTKNPYITFIQVKSKQAAKCRLCMIFMYDCTSIINHTLGKKHLQREKNSDLPMTSRNSSSDNSQSTNNNKIVTLRTVPVKPSSSKSSNPKQKNNYETSTEELVKLGFSVENLNSATSIESISLDVDDALNNLISLDLTVSQKKKLSRSSRVRKPRKPNAEGKKTISSFNQSAYIWGKSYIKHCINLGAYNIYNINPDKLRLLKLGTSLIFPWQSEHACLVCGEQFVNQQILFEHLQDAKHIENLQLMEESDKEFQFYDKQFSDLELAKNYMQEESNDLVHCYACENKVKNDDTYIRLHIAELNHINKSQLWRKLSDEIYKNLSVIFEEAWYYAQVFVCDICKIKNHMEIDFVMHLETQKHVQNVTKLLQKGIMTKFGMCPVCITCWYASSDFYTVHCQDQLHKRFAKNGDFMIPNMTITALDLLVNVDEQIDFLINESNKAVLEKYKETELLKAIEETVESIYPNAKAHTFGSRLSHLGFVDSDVDVFLDCNNLYYSRTTKEQSQHYLMSVKKNFETKPNIWIVDEVLLVTRVPILKLRHIPTMLKCDISFINGLSWECGFVDNFSANHSDLNFREHLKGFFNYYAEFDYKTYVACPYLGKIIKKHTFAYKDELPIEMQIYKYRLQLNYVETFRFDSPMCIQDPIDLSQNITKAVKKHHLRCFRQYCTESAAKC